VNAGRLFGELQLRVFELEEALAEKGAAVAERPGSDMAERRAIAAAERAQALQEELKVSQTSETKALLRIAALTNELANAKRMIARLEARGPEPVETVVEKVVYQTVQVPQPPEPCAACEAARQWIGKLMPAHSPIVRAPEGVFIARKGRTARVVNAIFAAGRPLTANEIAESVDCTPQEVRQTIGALVRDGSVLRFGQRGRSGLSTRYSYGLKAAS